MSASRGTVFVSYAHRDREWLDRLRVHLHPLEHDEALDCWDDTRISAGATWFDEIKTAIDRSRVAVLLISADFLASDFIARVELPALLQAARQRGLVVMPLIVSPSRFASEPSLGELQALNDPARPLLSLDRAEQERVFVGVADAVESVLALSRADRASETTSDNAAGRTVVDHIPLADCLARLGCPAAHIEEATRVATQWLVRRSGEIRFDGDAPDVGAFMRGLGVAESDANGVQAFCDHVLSWCAPRHDRVARFYLSTKKVADAYRQMPGAAREGGESPRDKLVRLHSSLLREGRLGFLPARLLLGRALPARDDEMFFFAGTFRLIVAEAELDRVPGARQAITAASERDLYGLVSAVFKNTDPFLYPMLTWEGALGRESVTMLLSRDYLSFDSMTASSMVAAVRGTPVRLAGIGVLGHGASGRVLRPLCCSIDF